MRQPRILFFLKFCERREYAEDFLRGHLYLNSVDFFKKLEGANNDGRADRDESPLLWVSPKRLVNVRFSIGPSNLDLPPEVFAGPIRINARWKSTQHLLCLYAGHTGTLEPPSSGETLQALRNQMRLPPECSRMGEFAVLIRGEFLQRFRKVIEERDYDLEGDLVNYFDPREHAGHFDRPLFWKRNEYSWQREYRLVVDTDTEDPAPLKLELGDLSDICRIVEVSGLNETMSITSAWLPGM
jgi:hypothetical protein